MMKMTASTAKSIMNEVQNVEYQHFLDTEDLAKLLKINKRTLYSQIHAGTLDIPYMKNGKKYLFPTEAVVAHCEESLIHP